MERGPLLLELSSLICHCEISRVNIVVKIWKVVLVGRCLDDEYEYLPQCGKNQGV